MTYFTYDDTGRQYQVEKSSSGNWEMLKGGEKVPLPSTQSVLQMNINPDKSYNMVPIYTGASSISPATSAAGDTSKENPASGWTYRPSNQYSQYYGSNQTGNYGRSPLAPYLPQAPNGSGRPSAATLIASLGRASPVGGLGWRPGMAPATAPPGAPAAMATGGAVRGAGGGQEDSVFTGSKPKNFILPADVVADIGDGSSNEGHRRLLDTWKRLGINVEPRMAHGGVVPVALSQDEHEVPVEAVARLGGGSVARGTDMLHSLIRKVRAHKARKGMPPPAKSPLTYMGVSK